MTRQPDGAATIASDTAGGFACACSGDRGTCTDGGGGGGGGSGGVGGAGGDGSGELDRNEFELCLRSLDLGLSKGQIQALMVVADTDRTGQIDREEFMSIFSERF